MMLKFIHAADFHLDSAFGGLPTEKARERRRDYEDDYEPPQRGGGAGVKVLAGITVVLALALVYVLFNMISDSFQQQAQEPQTYAVPSVVGYTPEQAANLAEVKDIFILVEKGSEFHDEYPEGVIVRQSPTEGSHRKGDNLTIEGQRRRGHGRDAGRGQQDRGAGKCVAEKPEREIQSGDYFRRGRDGVQRRGHRRLYHPQRASRA